MQAFKNITVLDLSQGIAGPMCAGILARQGARVIKVEPPSGDWIRGTGSSREKMSANAIAGNLNKRGIAIDAAKPEGKAALLRLVKQADVLVENFRTGVMVRLGLDYATLSALNPRLVYCSVTGFGPVGPLVNKAATDSVVQAFTGMAALNGGAGNPPRRIGMYVPDNISAIYSAQAVSAALFERFTTERGQHVQISLAQCTAGFQAGPMIDSFLFPDTGKRSAVLAPAGDFQTQDGWVAVAALTDDMFVRLAKAVGREQWLSDPKFGQLELRKANSADINAALAEVLRTDTNANWVRKLEAADVLIGGVNDFIHFREEEQSKAMGYFGEIEQAPYGALTVPHLPGGDRELRPAPRVGEHTREVLLECGFTAAEIDALLASGVALQKS